MKLSAFENIIRKVVREEIDYALKREISPLKEGLMPPSTQPKVGATENVEDFRSKLRSQIAPEFNTGNGTLDSLLSETAQSPTAEETFNSNDPVNQFANKDYTQLLTAIDKKKDYRP